jgi:GDP-L-fucose synthase
MLKISKIFVAGHRGLVGSAIYRRLLKDGYENVTVRTSKELDLTVQKDVDEFFEKEKIEYVFLAAAKVGGILANNTYKADFIYRNLMIQCNVIHCSYKYGVKKLLFLGSNCIYPKVCNLPIKEEYLLDGKLEPTNQPYALAKLSGIEMCNSYRDQYGCNFISLMPTNLYGPNDNYDLETSHVLPGLLRKFIEAKKHNLQSVSLWGTGKPRREFLHSDDVSDACLYFMNTYNDKCHINIGTGKDISIKELSEIIKEVVGFEGEIIFDKDKPDGTFRKVFDVSKAKDLGWEAKISLKEGIKITYELIKDVFDTKSNTDI